MLRIITMKFTNMKGSFFYKQVEIQNVNFRTTASIKENKTRYGDVFKKDSINTEAITREVF